jgi:hypothetical protein
MKTLKRHLLISSGLLLFSAISFPYSIFGQTANTADSIRNFGTNDRTFQKRKSFKMTTLTFGGNGINITRINNQLTVMTGGRGSATFNDRYTIGGGGWGMIKGVPLENSAEGRYNFVKIGYGGVDFGYLIIPGEKFNLGTRLMVAGGALFTETVPESHEKMFRMFAVLEPAAYYQVSLGKLFRLEMGASYRFIYGINLPYVSNKEMSGFSFYMGLLVKACNCK